MTLQEIMRTLATMRGAVTGAAEDRRDPIIWALACLIEAVVTVGPENAESLLTDAKSIGETIRSGGTMPPETEKIGTFSGQWRPLSNFHQSPVWWGDDLTPARIWPDVETPYQLAKTLNPQVRLSGILIADRGAGPGAMKKWGNRVRPLRADWESIKVQLMRELVFDKFERTQSLWQLLVSSGDRLIEEGNTWGDVVWGVTLYDIPGRGLKKGDGQNLLGKLLMETRDRLRALDQE